jgi:hypothetical protein
MYELYGFDDEDDYVPVALRYVTDKEEDEAAPLDGGQSYAQQQIAKTFASIRGEVVDATEDLIEDTKATLDARNQNWWADAACHGLTKYFYPEFALSGRSKESAEVKDRREDMAIAICGTCQVREYCLRWAEENKPQKGVWGGLREKEQPWTKAGKKEIKRLNEKPDKLKPVEVTGLAKEDN